MSYVLRAMASSTPPPGTPRATHSDHRAGAASPDQDCRSASSQFRQHFARGAVDACVRRSRSAATSTAGRFPRCSPRWCCDLRRRRRNSSHSAIDAVVWCGRHRNSSFSRAPGEETFGSDRNPCSDELVGRPVVTGLPVGSPVQRQNAVHRSPQRCCGHGRVEV